MTTSGSTPTILSQQSEAPQVECGLLSLALNTNQPELMSSMNINEMERNAPKYRTPCIMPFIGSEDRQGA